MTRALLVLIGMLGMAQNVQAQRLPVPAKRYVVIMKSPSEGGPIESSYDSVAGLKPWYKYREPFFGFAATLSDSAKDRLTKSSVVLSVSQDEFIYNRIPVRASATSALDRRWALTSIGAGAVPETGGTGVTVYVLDSGLRSSHQEFGGRATLASDFMGDQNDDGDCNGHGTHVAGIIGGRTYGVARGVRLIGVRVLDCGGFGTASSVIAGLGWVVANIQRPAVINLSLVTLRDVESEALDSAINKLVFAGITIVTAAGNSGKDACDFSPAHDEGIITVGASDSKLRRAGFSNWGKCLMAFAPGVDIIGANKDDDTTFALQDGTSMSAALVSGVVALMLQQDPTLKPSAIRNRLLLAAKTGLSNLNGSPDRAIVLPP